MKTLIALRHLEIGGHVFAHGAEIIVGLLPPEVVDWHIDRKEILELDSGERRSLYRLFPSFSGCSEAEQLSSDELTSYTLPS